MAIMTDQPTADDLLYAALLRRDRAYDGRVFACVRTTGIYCRLSCAARKPKRENVCFLPGQAECEAAGYRACRRCHPNRM